MSQASRKNSEGSRLASTHPAFGAFNTSGKLLLVVEAEHVDMATSRVAQVGVLVCPRAQHPLRISRLDSAPIGVPIFFDAYFDEAGGGGAVSRVGPSSRSFQ